MDDDRNAQPTSLEGIERSVRTDALKATVRWEGRKSTLGFISQFEDRGLLGKSMTYYDRSQPFMRRIAKNGPYRRAPIVVIQYRRDCLFEPFQHERLS